MASHHCLASFWRQTNTTISWLMRLLGPPHWWQPGLPAKIELCFEVKNQGAVQAWRHVRPNYKALIETCRTAYVLSITNWQSLWNLTTSGVNNIWLKSHKSSPSQNASSKGLVDHLYFCLPGNFVSSCRSASGLHRGVMHSGKWAPTRNICAWAQFRVSTLNFFWQKT